MSQSCDYNNTDLINQVVNSPQSVRYRVVIQCLSANNDGTCNNPRLCATPPGTVRYDVQESADGGPFTKVGEVCLTRNDAAALNGQINEQMVEQVFDRLDWPASAVVVQPPNGRTLVNFRTNFYTANTQPMTQSVPLLDQTVQIEATPTSWTWHYGDGADQTTTVPGAAYPDLQVTHEYADANVTVHPSVDTVYRGRYRINGGPWQPITATRTIPGAPVDLTVVEAQPVLVAPSP